MPTRRQAIVWTNDDQITDANMRHSASVGWSVICALRLHFWIISTSPGDQSVIITNRVKMWATALRPNDSYNQCSHRRCDKTWWRHQMETFSALLGHCAGEFPAQRPVTRSFDVFFDLRPNKRFSKQPWGWWFETPSWSLWRQCNEPPLFSCRSIGNQTVTGWRLVGDL